MSQGRQPAIYRALTALYPRSFRDDYRDDLVVLFSHQLADEPSLGIWARTLRDLAVTVPTYHLEARMPVHPPLSSSGSALTVRPPRQAGNTHQVQDPTRG